MWAPRLSLIELSLGARLDSQRYTPIFLKIISQISTPVLLAPLPPPSLTQHHHLIATPARLSFGRGVRAPAVLTLEHLILSVHTSTLTQLFHPMLMGDI